MGIQCDPFCSAWRFPGTSRSWKHVHWGPSPWVSGIIVNLPSCQEDSLQPGGPLAPEGNLTGQPDGVEALKQTFTPIAQSISIFFLLLTFCCYAWFDHWNTNEVVTRMTMTFLANMAVAYIFRWVQNCHITRSLANLSPLREMINSWSACPNTLWFPPL